ncbi:MAG: hypothetical protein ABI175_20110, partial [Polyangiales bacterium]
MKLLAAFEIPPTDRGFATGLLLDLVAALRACPPGGLVALTSRHLDVPEELERWARFTGNAIVARTEEAEGPRWVVRNGPAPAEPA